MATDAGKQNEAADLASLLGLMSCNTVDDLQGVLGADLDGDLDIVQESVGGDDEEIVVRVGVRGTALRFPLSVGELWEIVEDLEEEYQSGIACAGLADEIDMIEGFSVVVTIDYYCDENCVSPDQRRRELSSGVVVQFPTPYPYDSGFRGDARFDEWVRERFLSHFQGLDVELAEVQGLDPDMTLAELRESGTR